MQQFHHGSAVIKESSKEDIVDIKLDSHLLTAKREAATAASG